MDTAILSAKIFTGLKDQPWGEAIGLKDGRIAAFGTNDQVRAACTDATEILDLPGRTVTPGLVDAHCHFMSFGRALTLVDLTGAASWEECRQRISDYAATKKPGEWILGRGWNHHQWTDTAEPTKADLDDITPDNPVMMVRVCGHSVVVNSAALKAARISAETPDPDGGRIERDAEGNPTGMLRAARQMIEAVIPEPTLEEKKGFALAAQEAYLAAGITGVHTCESLKEYEPVKALDDEGNLKIRIHHLLQVAEVEEAVAQGITAGTGSDHLWVSQIKLFSDGSLGSGTALLFEGYADDPENTGIAYTTPEDLKAGVALSYRHGFDVAIHAIGDKGVNNVLNAIKEAREEYPGEHRDRVEHVQLHRDEDRQLFADMDVVGSIQPVFLPTDWATADKKWGPERTPTAYAWKKLMDDGIRVQFGSDAPVEPIDPILGVKAAMTRQTLDGRPQGGWYPDQKLSLEESLEGFFKTAAWTARHEDSSGPLAVGNWADLTVFKADLSAAQPLDWPTDIIEMTVIDGKVEYRG